MASAARTTMLALTRTRDCCFTCWSRRSSDGSAMVFIRERLLGLARDWDQGPGPRALLACPPGERHDIGLICFGLVLSRSGWRITFLGPDTPVTALTEAAAAVSPDLIVLTATREDRFTSIMEPLHAVAAALLIAGSPLLWVTAAPKQATDERRGGP